MTTSQCLHWVKRPNVIVQNELASTEFGPYTINFEDGKYILETSTGSVHEYRTMVDAKYFAELHYAEQIRKQEKQDEIDDHTPDSSGYSYADEDWFFGMDERK